MTTPTEAVARLLAKDAHFHDVWPDVPEEARERYMRRASALLRAADVARWRKPREPEDWESWEDFLVIYWENGQWCGIFQGPLQHCAPKDPAIEVMIADPLALPPAPKVTP
jgi:hypothetical protein